MDFAPEGVPGYENTPVLYEWQVEQVQRKLARLRFCPKCSAESIMDCPHCEAPIEYDDEVPGERPSYCSSCGQPFPWTEATLTKAKKFTDQQDALTIEEKEVLKGVYEDLIGDAPGKEVQASWFNGLLRKLKPDAAEVIRQTLVEIVSSTTAKLLRP